MCGAPRQNLYPPETWPSGLRTVLWFGPPQGYRAVAIVILVTLGSTRATDSRLVCLARRTQLDSLCGPKADSDPVRDPRASLFLLHYTSNHGDARTPSSSSHSTPSHLRCHLRTSTLPLLLRSSPSRSTFLFPRDSNPPALPVAHLRAMDSPVRTHHHGMAWFQTFDCSRIVWRCDGAVGEVEWSHERQAVGTSSSSRPWRDASRR